MTLYQLIHSMTVCGNIEIKVFDILSNEKEAIFIRSTDDLAYEGDIYDFEDLEITWIYSTKSCDGTVWTTIELLLED